MIATPTELSNFVETYQTRHISRAAIRLGITQPTLTQSLQKLEAKVGAKLFHRTKQGVVPTEGGNLLYARAGKLLETWKEVGAHIADSRTELRGNFRVGCHPSVGTFVLPRLFANLGGEAPGIKVTLVHDFSRKVTERVVSYEIELGYVVNPVKHPDLVLKKIGDDRVSFWKRKGLANIPPRIFADRNLKQVESLLDKSFRREFRGWDVVETSSLEVARELVAAGQGVGVLPGRVAGLAGSELAIYRNSLPVFHDEIFLAYRKEVLSSGAGQALVRLASTPLA